MIYQIYRTGPDGRMSLFDEVGCPRLALRVQNVLVLDGNSVTIRKIPFNVSRLAQRR